MKYFAIRQISTGYYLPELGKFSGAGYTNDIPTPPSIVPPRLFTSEGPAKCALTWWLKGVTSKLVYSDGYGEYDETWSTSACLDRKAEDMEIAKVTLEEQ